MKQAHERLTSLHSAYSELYAALKHQAERARKTAKTLRDTGTPMKELTTIVGGASRRGVLSAMAFDAAIARTWEEYASHLEGELLGPAKQECNALFAESDAIWSQYLGIVNELAARQGKERLLHGKKGEPAPPTAERLREVCPRSAARCTRAYAYR